MQDLATIEFPKQKFPKPVVAAIFFYGYADEGKPKEESDKKAYGPEGLVPGLRTDITFPGLSENIPAEVRASVARLHINAGHPSKQELTRLLNTHGAISSQTLSCVEHLVCGSCKRTTNPQHPRPSAVPVLTGQFGERIQIDRFWIRDLQGVNHCFLGVVDMATTYQQAVRLEANGSEYVYSILSKMWLQPFGHPLVVEADDDRNFGGYFKEMIEGAGTHLLIVPAEAHWRIGTVERRNAILRTIAEKMIDEKAVTDGAMLDYAMIAACQAINSSTTTRGRSPYQAVFGKVPRCPGDHFGDERSLLVNHDFNYTEELRCQALRIIAETRASHVIRRALLRKTATSRQEAQSILPGSLAAYWRWSKKSKGRNRGGYVLGRLLNHDPDQKSAWIHNGASVVQVTHEQLRPAFNIKSWTPSSQDIQILKDGARKLQLELWEDERGPGRSVEEPFDIEMDAPPELVLPLAPPAAEQPPTPSPQPATPAPLPTQRQPLTPLPLHGQQAERPPQPLVYSPTYNQRNVQNIHQHFGPSRATTRSRTAPYQSTATEQHTAITAEQTPAPAMMDTTTQEAQAYTQQATAQQPLPVTDMDDETADTNMTLFNTKSTFSSTTTNNLNRQKQPYPVWMTDYFNHSNFQITPIPDHWDGRPELSTRKQQNFQDAGS